MKLDLVAQNHAFANKYQIRFYCEFEAQVLFHERYAIIYRESLEISRALDSKYMALVGVVENESYTNMMLSSGYNDSQFARVKYEQSQKELDRATEYTKEHQKETECR